MDCAYGDSREQVGREEGVGWHWRGGGGLLLDRPHIVPAEYGKQIP